MILSCVSLIVITAVLSVSCVSLLLMVASRFPVFTGLKEMPLVGGIAIGVVYALFIAVSASGQRSPLPEGFIAASFLMFAGGLWDDVRELSVAGKIVMQAGACAILIGGGVRTHIVFLGEAANIAVTVVWVLAVTNAFNLLDIMDGLCAAIALVVATGLLAVCIMNGNPQNARLLAVMIGSVAGFLVFNMPPARAYLGNAGSHFIGFMLAAVSISIPYATSDRPVALLSPVLIMGFPLFDTLFVAMMRLKNGRSAIRKSKDHLALRFLTLGHTTRRALAYMVVSACVFSLSGIFVSTASNASGVIVVFLVFMYFSLLTLKMKSVAVDEGR